MSRLEILTTANIVLTLGILLMLSGAVLPQLKKGLAIARDTVLWCALIAVVGFVSWVGWSQWQTRRGGPETETSSQAELPLAGWEPSASVAP
jgi:hypothetical protein